MEEWNTPEDLPVESEYIFEEQDLRVIKNILANPLIATDFVSSLDENIFVGTTKELAKHIISYIKAYKVPPTERVLFDKIIDSDGQGKLKALFEELQNIEINSSEYQYDLDKLKNRYANTKLASLRYQLDKPQNDLSNLFRYLKTEIDDLEGIQVNRKKTYQQKSLKHYVPEFKSLYNDRVKNKDLGKGILTGYSFLDYAKNGFQPGELLIIAAETAGGKAQPLNTKIPTNNGFMELNDIHPGQIVFDQTGKPCTVLAESKTYFSHGWKFIFNDGTEAISHPNHEWYCLNRAEQINFSRHKKINGKIRSTQEIVDSLYCKDGRSNYAILNGGPLQLPSKKLEIDPYLLGIWLGDGSSNDGVITTMDKEVIQVVESAGYVCSKINHKKNSKASAYRFVGLRSLLKKINVFQNKHIPFDYLWASEEQRLSLLQGLMDSDGFASQDGKLVFTNTNKNLIDGMKFLINSLGEKCSVSNKQGKLNGVNHKIAWNIYFSARFPVFKLPRKLSRQNLKPRLNKFRYIVKAEKTEIVPMKCLEVSSYDHMYLTGTNLIPTHNSMMLNNIATQMWMQKNTVDNIGLSKGYNVLYFSLEMPFEACFRRTISRIADVPAYGMRDASLARYEIDALNKSFDFIQKYPYEFEIVDIPRGVTVEQVEARFLEAKAKYNPDIVVVDYLGLLEDPNAAGDDWLRLGTIAGKLHELARYYNIVMMTAAQLNRPQKSKDPGEQIGIHRVGRSSLILHHANVAIQIETRPQESTYSDLRYHLIKNRDGIIGNHFLIKNFKNCSLKDPEIPYSASETILPVEFQNEDISNLLEKYNWGNKSD